MDTVPLAARGAGQRGGASLLGPLLADSITQIFTDGSVSQAFAGENELF